MLCYTTRLVLASLLSVSFWKPQWKPCSTLAHNFTCNIGDTMPVCATEAALLCKKKKISSTIYNSAINCGTKSVQHCTAAATSAVRSFPPEKLSSLKEITLQASFTHGVPYEKKWCDMTKAVANHTSLKIWSLLQQWNKEALKSF